MQEFLAWLSRILDSWKFWVVIAPWELGVRIRMGKNATSLRPGPHFRIPFIDAITLVNTRLRIDGTPPVTVSGSAANATRYISATVGFRISDPLKAMLKFGAPGPVVVSKTQGEIAVTRDESKVTQALKAYFDADSGISIEFVKFVEDVEVRTYRLINGNSWIASGHESLGNNGTASMRY
jgi:hypothetical protein